MRMLVLFTTIIVVVVCSEKTKFCGIIESGLVKFSSTLTKGSHFYSVIKSLDHWVWPAILNILQREQMYFISTSILSDLMIY